MQKRIIALTITAALIAPAAMADTANVNVYGFIDGGMRSLRGAAAPSLAAPIGAANPGVTSNTFGSGTYNSNRWGIKGSEDLGDGMQATFNLEGGFNTGTGAIEAATPTLFGRIATVGLIGGFGKVDLGRQFTVSFKTINLYDPFRHNFIAITNAFANINSPFYDNDISYTAKVGDLVVMAEHTVPGTGDDSTSASALGLKYESGTIFAGAAYTATKPAATSNLEDKKHYTVGGGLKFGDGKVYVGYTKEETTAASPTATGKMVKNMWLGASYDVSSKIGVTAAYYKNSTEAAATVATPAAELIGSRLMVAGTYALSKRSKFYIEADKTTSEAQTAAGAAVTSNDSNGYSLGLAHTF